MMGGKKDAILLWQEKTLYSETRKEEKERTRSLSPRWGEKEWGAPSSFLRRGKEKPSLGDEYTKKEGKVPPTIKKKRLALLV